MHQFRVIEAPPNLSNDEIFAVIWWIWPEDRNINSDLRHLRISKSSE